MRQRERTESPQLDGRVAAAERQTFVTTIELALNASKGDPCCTISSTRRIAGPMHSPARLMRCLFDSFVAREFAKWSRVIKQAGIEPN